MISVTCPFTLLSFFQYHLKVLHFYSSHCFSFSFNNFFYVIFFSSPGSVDDSSASDCESGTFPLNVTFSGNKEGHYVIHK